MVVMVAVWLQSASILNKAFNGVVLNNFFNIKSFPIVNNMIDIYKNKQLSILMDDRIEYLLGYLPDEPRYRLLGSITKRAKNFLTTLNTSYGGAYMTPKFRELIIKKRLVIICGEDNRKMFHRKHPALANRMMVLEQKYLRQQVNLFILREAKLTKVLRFL